MARVMTSGVKGSNIEVAGKCPSPNRTAASTLAIQKIAISRPSISGVADEFSQPGQHTHHEQAQQNLLIDASIKRGEQSLPCRRLRSFEIKNLCLFTELRHESRD